MQKKIIALYLILKIWSQKFGVSSFHFCSVYYRPSVSLIQVGTEKNCKVSTFSPLFAVTKEYIFFADLYGKPAYCNGNVPSGTPRVIGHLSLACTPLLDMHRCTSYLLHRKIRLRLNSEQEDHDGPKSLTRNATQLSLLREVAP